MKNLYLFSLALMLGVTPAFADNLDKGQESQSLVTGVGPTGPFPHFGTQQATGAPGPGAIGSRLIACTKAYYSGGIFEGGDSTWFSYNGDRGGAPDIDNPQSEETVYFDECFTYKKDAGNYKNYLHQLQYYGSGDRVTNLTFQIWHSGNYWKDSVRYRYTYDNNLRLEKTNYETWYGTLWNSPGVTSALEYDANNNIKKVTQPNTEIHYIYNANQKVLSTLHLEKIGGVWQNKMRHAYGYDGAGRIISDTLQKWNVSLSTWEHDKVWSYTYTGTGNDIIEETEKWYSNVNGWVNYSRKLYTFDANNNRISDVTQIWEVSGNKYFNTIKVERTYNGYNQPETVTSSAYDKNSGSWVHTQDDYQYRFYYATYFATDVADVTKQSDEISLFPIPATNMLNVKMNRKKSVDFQVGIYDMTGRMVKHWTEAATSSYSGQISVADLPSGRYMLTVSDADGKTVKPFVVAR